MYYISYIRCLKIDRLKLITANLFNLGLFYLFMIIDILYDCTRTHYYSL